MVLLVLQGRGSLGYKIQIETLVHSKGNIPSSLITIISQYNALQSGPTLLRLPIFGAVSPFVNLEKSN